jgi:hypothetical protein
MAITIFENGALLDVEMGVLRSGFIDRLADVGLLAGQGEALALIMRGGSILQRMSI